MVLACKTFKKPSFTQTESRMSISVFIQIMVIGLDSEITKGTTIIIGNLRFSDSSSLLIISLYFFTLSVSVGLWNRIRKGNPSSVNSSAFSKVISRTSGIHFCCTQVYSSSKLSSEPRYVSSGSTEVFLSVLKTTIG